MIHLRTISVPISLAIMAVALSEPAYSEAAADEIKLTITGGKAKPDPVCVGDMTMATFMACLFKGEKNNEAPPADKEIKEQKYRIFAGPVVDGKFKRDGGVIEDVAIGAETATLAKKNQQQTIADFKVTFEPDGSQVTLVKQNKSNKNPCLEIMVTVMYTRSGDKVITLLGDVTIAGEAKPRPTEAATVKLVALELFIEPVAPATVIDANSKINRIINPAGIVILDKSVKPDMDPDHLAITEDNAAKIVMTVTKNAAGDASKLVDGKITWEIKGVDLDSGVIMPGKGGKALFLQGGKSSPSLVAGDTVFIYGTDEGRIRVTATLAGAKMPCEFYEALVVKQRILPFRVQLLRLQKLGNEIPPGTSVDPLEAVAYVKIANVYSRQRGVLLKPDPNTKINPAPAVTVKDGIQLAKDKNNKDIPGFFTVTLKRDKTGLGLVQNVETPREVIRINNMPEITQIAFIESLTRGRRGTNQERPETSVKDPVKIIYRIEGHKESSDPMMLAEKNLFPDGKTWGVAIANPVSKEDLGSQQFGQVIAHETGHLLSLRHRARGKDPDGLKLPLTQNVMLPEASKAAQKDDFDLPQVIAVQGSKALK
jgi:hypothetical protein